MDEDGLITEWNAQAEAVFGWSRSEVLGRVLAETIIPSQYRTAHEHGLLHFLATGQGPMLNKSVELTCLKKNGVEFPVEVIVWPIRVNNKYTFSAFVRDITARKKAEEALAAPKPSIATSSRTPSRGSSNPLPRDDISRSTLPWRACTATTRPKT